MPSSETIIVQLRYDVPRHDVIGEVRHRSAEPAEGAAMLLWPLVWRRLTQIIMILVHDHGLIGRLGVPSLRWREIPRWLEVRLRLTGIVLGVRMSWRLQ